MKKSQDLSNRKLKSLEDNLLKEIKEGIHKLKLSNNQLATLPLDKLIVVCPQLRIVHLSKNSLSTIGSEIGLFGYLEELKLDHNQLESLPVEVSMLTRLRKLDLSYNHLRSLPIEISRLTDLDTLDISRNYMRYLPPSMCFLTQLKSLDFTDNPLFIRPPQPKDITAILAFLRTLHDSLVSPCTRFQVTMQKNRGVEGPQDLWYRDHNVYFQVSWTVHQDQGARPYQEDRYTIIPDLHFEDKPVEYVDSFANLPPEERRRKKNRLTLDAPDTDTTPADIPVPPATSESPPPADESPKTSKSKRDKEKDKEKEASAAASEDKDEDAPKESSSKQSRPAPLVRGGSEPSGLQKAGTVRTKKGDRSSSGTPQARRVATLSEDHFSFFGVYDGHGGDKAAILLKDNLHKYLLNQREDIKNGEWSEALCRAFLQLDKAFLKTCRREGWHDGSTGIVIVIKPPRLYIANVGDSRAVLCRGKKCIGLSSDHKPDREDEQERIESFGGSVVNTENTGWIPRVNGHLAISRSVGDIRLKDPPQGLTAEPEICELELHPDDQFIIMATDGLWDVMTNQEAVDLVRKCSDKQKAAEALVDKALKLGSADNITVVIVWLTWNLEHVNATM